MYTYINFSIGRHIYGVINWKIKKKMYHKTFTIILESGRRYQRDIQTYNLKKNLNAKNDKKRKATKRKQQSTKPNIEN